MERAIRVIVAGPRTFNDYKLLAETLDTYLPTLYTHLSDVQIVSGGARGADWLGELYATRNGIYLHVKPADWNRYGKGAGFIRNKQMADYATHCLCFQSSTDPTKGTQHMIDTANKALRAGTIKEVVVVLF